MDEVFIEDPYEVNVPTGFENDPIMSNSGPLKGNKVSGNDGSRIISANQIHNPGPDQDTDKLYGIGISTGLRGSVFDNIRPLKSEILANVYDYSSIYKAEVHTNNVY